MEYSVYIAKELLSTRDIIFSKVEIVKSLDKKVIFVKIKEASLLSTIPNNH